MASYYFKLLGSVNEDAEKDLDIPFDISVAEVKEIVRKAYKMIPGIEIDLMVNGRKLSNGSNWGNTDAKPNKSKILVIGHR